jgi:transketolase
VLRPCDQIETFEAWEIALNSTNTPSVLALSRQNLPLIRKDFKINRSMMGAYQLSTNKNSKLSIFASGSEVEIAVRISKILKDNDINSNVISVPCTRLFDTQSQLYKDKILSNLPRVFIEAGSSDTWYKYSDKNDLICGVNHFGESGKGNDVYAHFGLEDKQILKKIMVKFF